MDGRNLIDELIPQWDPSKSLYDIALLIPIFAKKVLNISTNHFFGNFSLGSVYDLRNYNNMITNSFNCRIDHSMEVNPRQNRKISEGEHRLVLSDDCLILFEKIEKDPDFGKIIFWSTLYAITDLQINKDAKIAKLSFYSDEKNDEKSFRLYIYNILFFREALVSKMRNLKVKVEINRLLKGKVNEKRLSQKDLNSMDIDTIERTMRIYYEKISANELSYYIINTYTILCRKAIEYYSAKGDSRHNDILLDMQEILIREDVQILMNSEID